MLIAGALWVAAGFVVQLALVFVPVFLALLLTTLLHPPARWLMQRGLPPLLAVLLVFLTAIGLVTALGFFVVPRVIEELQRFDDVADRARSFLTDGPLHLSDQQIQSWVERAEQAVTQGGPSLIRSALARVFTVLEVAAAFVLMLVLAFFFTKDGERMIAWIKEQLPEPTRDHVAQGSARAWGQLGAYIQGNVVVGLAQALMFVVALLLIGVPLVAPIGVIAFFGGFFPFVGVVVTGLVAASVALVANGIVDALLVLAALVVVQQIEGNLLEPVILSRAVNLHPVVILVVVTAGFLLWGILGALLAVPLTTGLAEVVGYAREVRTGEDERVNASPRASP